MTAAAPRLEAVGGVVRRALQWWGEGLVLALPHWLVALALGDRRAVRVEIDGTTGGLRARLEPSPFAQAALTESSIGGASEDEAALRKIVRTARTRPVILSAPDDLILTQTTFVPQVALENLAQAVRFGLSTWTPFTEDMLIYHADVLELRGERVKVRIRMVPRKAIEPYLAAAHNAGLTVQSVAFGRDVVDLGAPGAGPRSRLTRGDRIDLALLGVVLALTVALLTALHLGWSRELADLQVEIRSEIAHRSKQAALEKQLSQLEERRRAVAVRRAREPRLAAIVAEIANRLPDEAKVIELSWGAGRGRLVAAAPAEVDLREALNASPSLAVGPPSRAGGERVAFDLTAKEASR